MIVYGSAIESTVPASVLDKLRQDGKLQHLLISYYYLRKNKGFKWLNDIEDLIIDSGAHSFQKGAHVDWVSYTHEYAKWIRENDTPRIRGYFEMDVDNIIGYENVLKLRHILLTESGHPEKIIPVWHRNRGIPEFEKMVSEHSIAAVTGFKNEDIQDHQYLMFLKEAWKNNCWLHGLGMTRKSILDKVPFDSVDSSSWKLGSVVYGNFHGRKLSRAQTGTPEGRAMLCRAAYNDLLAMQKHYEKKYRRLGVHNHPPIL